jgi:hypothetical protein
VPVVAVQVGLIRRVDIGSAGVASQCTGLGWRHHSHNACPYNKPCAAEAVRAVPGSGGPKTWGSPGFADQIGEVTLPTQTLGFAADSPVKAIEEEGFRASPAIRKSAPLPEVLGKRDVC